jgi:excisionase family DNA binding protein
MSSYLTDREVATRYSVSRPTIWRWVRLNHLPAPERIGPNTQRWRVAALEDWDAKREQRAHEAAA